MWEKAITNSPCRKMADNSPVEATPHTRWIKEVEQSGRGPEYLIEDQTLISEALTKEISRQRNARGPIWLGRQADERNTAGRLFTARALAEVFDERLIQGG